MTAPPDPVLPVEFVTLTAGGQSFCIEITQIREIRRWSPVTLLPHSPPSVLGVMNLRGAVIPIIDLGARLGFGPSGTSARHVVIVVTLEGRTVGCLVDSVSEILTVDSDLLRETPHFQGDPTSRYIRAVIARDEGMTRVLDLAALIPPAEAA